MLGCSTEKVSVDSNFEEPILTSEGEKYLVLGSIVKREIDIRIFVTAREIVIVQKRVEAH